MKYPKRKLVTTKLLILILIMCFITNLIQAQLIQHLDASVDSTVIRDGSGIVSSWLDISGNGNDAVKSAGDALYPSTTKFNNGLDAIDLSGGRVSLELLSSAKSKSILDQSTNPNGFCIVTVIHFTDMANTLNDIIGNSSNYYNSDVMLLRLDDAGAMRSNIGGMNTSSSVPVATGKAVDEITDVLRVAQGERRQDRGPLQEGPRTTIGQ